MTKKNSLIVHAGLIKTGSSFLQQEIFTKISEELHYIDSVGRINTRDFFQANNQICLLSNENLLGHPLLHDRYRKSFFSQFKDALIKVEQVFNQPKWIIGFREPASFIKSTYKQHLHEWGTLSWDEFMVKHKKMITNDLFFSKYIQFLNSFIPAERLFLYHFDQLKSEPEKLLKRMLQFIGINNSEYIRNVIKGAINKKANVGVKEEMIPLLLRLNRISEVLNKKIGLRLAFSLGRIRFNPTILCRDFLKSSLFESNQKIIDTNQLISIERHHRKDWQLTIELIHEQG